MKHPKSIHNSNYLSAAFRHVSKETWWNRVVCFAFYSCLVLLVHALAGFGAAEERSRAVNPTTDLMLVQDVELQTISRRVEQDGNGTSETLDIPLGSNDHHFGITSLAKFRIASLLPILVYPISGHPDFTDPDSTGHLLYKLLEPESSTIFQNHQPPVPSFYGIRQPFQQEIFSQGLQPSIQQLVLTTLGPYHGAAMASLANEDYETEAERGVKIETLSTAS